MSSFKMKVVLVLVLMVKGAMCMIEVEECWSAIESCTMSAIKNLFRTNPSFIYLYNGEPRTLPQNISDPHVTADVSRPILGNHAQWNNYVIDAVDERDLAIILSKLRESTLWRPRYSPKGHFVVSIKAANLHALFPIFWRIYVLNVIVVMEGGMFTCQPYAQGNNCTATCESPIKYNCNYSKVIEFPKKVSNYNKCLTKYALTIPKVEEEGYITGMLFKMTEENLVDRLNVTVERFVIEKETDTGDFLNLYEITLFYGGVCGYYENFDYGNPFIEDEFLWVGPPPESRMDVGAFFYPFDVYLWLILLGCLSVVTVVWYIIANANSSSSLTITSASVRVTSLCLGVALPRVPNGWPIRLLIIWLLIFIIHMHTAYNSNLINILVKPYYVKSVTSDDELAESNLPIFLPKLFIDMFFQLNSTDNAIYNKIRGRIQEGLRDPATTKCFTLSHRSIFDRTLAKYITTKPNVFVSETVAKGARYSSYMKKGHYFLEGFNWVVDWLTESGIYLHVHNVYDMHRRLILPKQSGWNNPLNLKHLAAAFLILAFGLTISLLTFFLELCIHRFSS